ncbi:peptidase S24/S26A/S26B/S26C [Scheffersomyces xylosifermentans]|uniref:peptidase S24/S26A/S26B/S26C n=1 Tax=Scheffersomyces xylosifermentans TaxID=1304137 RepID=UPI00315CF510
MKVPESLKFLVSTVSWTLRAGCVAHLVHEYVYEFTETRGESMLPTLQSHHDYVHALKKYRLGRNLDIGDCIVAIKPSDPDHRVCKRITGMPGDAILIDPSSSSELTNTPAEILQHDGFNKYIVIPEGHVWCTGDNLCHSLDSRSYSVLPMGLITGKIVAANSMDKGIFGGGLWNFRWIQNTFFDEKEEAESIS